MQKPYYRNGFIFICLSLLTFMSGIAVGQDYNGALELIFFGRQPSARAEAMGQSMITGEGDAFGAFYNPASIGQNKGLVLSTSYASPYYLATEANFKFLGATYELGKYGVLGLSLYRFSLGESLLITTETNPDGTNETFTLTTSMYSLTFSTEILKDLHAGLNFNFVRDKLGITGKAYPIDLGLLRVFYFRGRNVQRVTVGASLYNLINSNIEYDGVGDIFSNVITKQALPRTLHIGASYHSSFGKSQLNSIDLNTFGILLQVEYQDVLNSKFYNGFKAGAELSFIDMLYLRFGYYNIDRNDFGLPASNKDKITDFTYGFGVEIPVSNFTKMKIPLDVKLDMTSLKQPSGIKGFDNFENFSVYNLSVNWQL